MIKYFSFFVLILFSSVLHSQVMVLSPPQGGSMYFDFEHAIQPCVGVPDGWLNRNGTAECEAQRPAPSYPTDSDNELVLWGESVKRDISQFNLTQGTTINISIFVSVGALLPSVINADDTFHLLIYDSDPGISSGYGSGCWSPGNAGQLILSGIERGNSKVEFTGTITLSQNANWIVIANCDPSILNYGAVIDDLTITW